MEIYVQADLEDKWIFEEATDLMVLLEQNCGMIPLYELLVSLNIFHVYSSDRNS